MPALRALAFAGFLSLGAAARDDASDPVLPRGRMPAAKYRAFPALVRIVDPEESCLRGRNRQGVSSGSGFFLDDGDPMVRNDHVAGRATHLDVTLANCREVSARLVAGDAGTELAVLRVDPKEAFPGRKPVGDVEAWKRLLAEAREDRALRSAARGDALRLRRAGPVRR